MPMKLPNLDDRTYADLMAEAVASIPALYPRWTDHNPSNPGIALVELFAWLTEMLIYPANLVPWGGDQVSHLELVRELARRFNFETLTAEKVRPVARLTTRPAYEIRCRVHRR